MQAKALRPYSYPFNLMAVMLLRGNTYLTWITARHVFPPNTATAVKCGILIYFALLLSPPPYGDVRNLKRMNLPALKLHYH